MTHAESGSKAGRVSGEARTLAAQRRARQRALDALDGVASPVVRAQLAALVGDGALDAWLQTIERINYRRGYCVRDEAARRDAAAAEQVAILDQARARFIADGVTA
jgi:hypothetical protein